MKPTTSHHLGPAVLFGFLGALGGYDTAAAAERVRRPVESSAAAPALPRLELPDAPRPAWGLSQLAGGRHQVRPPRLDRVQLRRDALASVPVSRRPTLTRAGL